MVVSPGLAPSWLAVNAGRCWLTPASPRRAARKLCTRPGEHAPALPIQRHCLSDRPSRSAGRVERPTSTSTSTGGRRGSVAEDAYEPTRDAIIAAFEQLRDPTNPDVPVVAGVFRKEELRDVGGPMPSTRAGGDVVVTLAPPYRFDDAIEGVVVAKAIASRRWRISPCRRGRERRTLPGRWAGHRIRRVVRRPEHRRRTDGRLPPRRAWAIQRERSILFDLLADGSTLREVTLLDISDFHGQLTVERRRRRHRRRGSGELFIRRRRRRVPRVLVRPLPRGGTGRNSAGDGGRRGRGDAADLESSATSPPSRR